MTIEPRSLEEITKNTIARYSKRFAQHGYDVRSLGWGSREQQRYRFAQTLKGPIELRRKTVLDIGCGFGDYLTFLGETQQEVVRYEGWDVNPELVAEASRRHSGNVLATFTVKNLLGPSFQEDALIPVADVIVMLGVLNFNLAGVLENYTYSELAIRRALALSRHGLIVDFLSAYQTPEYAAEPWVFHHEPDRMLSFALSLSPFVSLMHNYLPIPQREFMLFIQREQ